MYRHRAASEHREPSARITTLSHHNPIPFMETHAPMHRKDSHGHNAEAMDKDYPAAADSAEATILEKIWQPLFDQDQPTMRLGQFLRGLAIHLIEDFEPQGSLVVTPAKMMQFLDETKVAQEHYPWTTIFGGRIANNSISTMYRKLLCQQHLIQKQSHEAPSIPGLTPIGFETFMTCMIQAHPDTEFERLAKAVQEMPISNADNKSERFPKKLSRRLLPEKPNKQAEQRLISSLSHEPELVPPEREAFAMPPPPPEPPLQSYVHERERKPYSQSSQQSQAVYGEDEDDLPPAMPIERERKPYSAKEGMGKRYETEDDRDRVYDRDGRPYRQDQPVRRSSRAGSGYSTATDPMNIPFANRSHRMSAGPPPAGHSWSNFTRRSPTAQNGFARSDPFDVGGISPSQYASNLNPCSGRDPAMRGARDPAMRDFSIRDPPMRDPSTREPSSRDRQDDDEYFNRPIPPRGGPPMPTNYDAPYPHRNSVNSLDDRRRSWYTGMPPTGMQPGGPGTDGYGSYSGSTH